MAQPKLHELREIKIEVTHRCDLNCIHCSSNAHPTHASIMSRADCLRIIKEAADLHVRDITFSGGEPFLWSHLPEAISCAASNNMDISVYTTGNSKGFAPLLSSIGKNIKTIIFSLFGSNAQTHERVTRVSGSFNKTKVSIRFTKEQGINTEIHFVPTARNYQALDQVVVMAEQLDISAVSILRLVPQGRAAFLPNDALTKAQNLDLQKMIQCLRQKSRVKIRTGSPYNFLLLNEDTDCMAAVNRVIISPNQDIYPCDAFKGISAYSIVKTDRLSNLSQSSLDDCWKNSPYLQAIRKTISVYPSCCKVCKKVSLCQSGCLAQKVFKCKNLTISPDPDCIM